MKKLASLLLALVMIMSCFSAMAEETHTITINDSKENHKYGAYQIFSGNLDTTETILSNIDWGNGVDGVALLAALKAEIPAYADCDNAREVAEVLSGFANNSTELDAFAQLAGKHLTTAAGTSTETAAPYTITGLADGYYLVKDENPIGTNDAATKYIIQVVDDVDVKVKSEVPTLDKNIIENDASVTENNASIGDVVDYELTSKVPAMDGYDKYFFIVHDTMSKGLTFNDDVKITIGSTELVEDTDFFVTENVGTDGTTIKIVFNDFIQYKAQVGDKITIKYSATLNQDAELNEDIGNPNTAHLQFSNNPNVDQNGTNEPGEGDVTGTTPDSTVITYVTGIQLTKVNENGETLTGAQFQISGESLNVVIINEEIYKISENGTYYRLKDGTYTETAPTEETADKYESTTVKYEKVTVVTQDSVSSQFETTGWVDANGVLTFEGLGEGTYTITELVAPDGYNMLSGPITVVVTWSEENGFSVTVDGEAVNANDNHLFAFNVVNESGTKLPETGGMGTTILYVGGGILVLAAIVLLIAKRRTAA